MNKNWFVFAVLALVVLLGVYFIFTSQKPETMPENMNQPTSGTTVKTGTSSGTPKPPVTAPAPSGGSVQVAIKGFSFVGQTTRISAGTTVTWKNFDDVRHTVVSDTGLFTSKVLNKGDSFSYTFTKSGDYFYHCSLHQNMNGQITATAQ